MSFKAWFDRVFPPRIVYAEKEEPDRALVLETLKELFYYANQRELQDVTDDIVRRVIDRMQKTYDSEKIPDEVKGISFEHVDLLIREVLTNKVNEIHDRYPVHIFTNREVSLVINELASATHKVVQRRVKEEKNWTIG